MKKQIIYHSNCGDGFCSAWLCHLVWPDAEFIPANYSWPPPDVTNNDVLIVDFSYPRETLLRMAASANKLQVLDHHETARKDLSGLSFCTLDMDKSGAHLTWDYLVHNDLLKPNEYWPGQFSSNKNKIKLHWLVSYVEDYDLHNNALSNHEEICAAIRNHDFTFDTYDQLAKRSPQSLIKEGAPVVRYQNWLITHHVKYAQIIEINGIKGLGSQCSMNKLWSRVGHAILHAHPDVPFAAIWQDTVDGTRLYSLRARKGEFDVGKLAESLGGGGHPSSAGFKVNCHIKINGPVAHLRLRRDSHKFSQDQSETLPTPRQDNIPSVAEPDNEQKPAISHE